jgi:signal transduction histidine kinase
MKILKNLNSYLIPSKVYTNPLEYRKATLLSWTHLFMIGGVIFTYMLMLPFDNAFFMPIPLWFIGVFLVSSYIMFYRWGNLVLSCNYVAIGAMIFITAQIPQTGGVFSDNISWMIVVPFYIFTILGIRWAMPWIIIMHFIFLAVYIYGKYHPSINVVSQDDDYYFASYSGLSVLLFGFMYLFEKSQTKVLTELNEKNIILEKQQIEIVEQSDALRLKDEKLRKSNADLQNFAYSASHDLKEPLRMIGMYTQLLQRRIAPTLDERSEEYMFYMTDGVKRMQKLLDDLLLYSRLGKNDNDVQDVDINQTILLVIYNLTVTIKETNTAIIFSNLPTICASSTEMMQLFQNMIANSIKFRRADVAPEIMIIHSERENEHVITLQDNGIGIKEEYKEKVFNIFTKLHSTSQYEGSGIGLATCKKIVEEMGGRMWLTSQEGVGTKFYFTFPKNSNKKKTEQKEAVLGTELATSN